MDFSNSLKSNRVNQCQFEVPSLKLRAGLLKRKAVSQPPIFQGELAANLRECIWDSIMILMSFNPYLLCLSQKQAFHLTAIDANHRSDFQNTRARVGSTWQRKMDHLINIAMKNGSFEDVYVQHANSMYIIYCTLYYKFIIVYTFMY